MMTSIAILALVTSSYGDFRARAELAWPEPCGITENVWHGSSLAYYQRMRFSQGLWSAIFITEKDQGEDWADMVIGGLSYTNPEKLTAAAGWLRVQFAHGLLLSHHSAWSSADPLELSKTPAWRMRLEPTGSPGTSDALPLTGAAAEYMFSGVAISTVLGWSKLDTGTSGLHRTVSELEGRRAVEEKLAAVRAGFGPVGVSFAGLSQVADSHEDNYRRAGADLVFATDEASVTGEAASDFDSTLNFVVSGSRCLDSVRYALTISRYTGNWPRSSGEFGSNHRIGAGCGVKWHIFSGVTLDAGALVLDRETGRVFKAGFLLSERPVRRTSLTQRLKCSATQDETTFRMRIAASWSPYSYITLALKIPAVFYRSSTDPDENGAGVEVRLKYSPVEEIDFALSAAAGSTDGWNSRVYAYSLSFPGEFGSRTLYNSSALLQGAVSAHISEMATLRVRGAWYTMDSVASIGSGTSETPRSSRTTAGVQLDWKF
jgi:hypothetical protein